jgi:hypothetical protein
MVCPSRHPGHATACSNRAGELIIRKSRSRFAMKSVLTLRLPPAIGAALTAAAASAQTSVSGFARSAIVAALPDNASLLPLPPSPPPRPTVVPAEDLAAIARFGGHLGRLTGATVQLSKALRESGQLPEHDALELEIRELRSTKAKVVAIVNRLRAAETALK